MHDPCDTTTRVETPPGDPGDPGSDAPGGCLRSFALRPETDPAGLPTLPGPPADGPPEAAADALARARRFHAGDPGAAGTLEPPGDDLLPALLHPFRDPRRVRHDYPLFLFPADPAGCGPLSAPLSELLKQLAEGFAPGGDDARILKDNFPRLERCVRDALVGGGAPVDAVQAIANAGREVEEALELADESAQALHDDLHALVQSVPAEGTLLALGEHAPLHLFLHAARRRARRTLSAQRAEAASLGNRLRDLLRLDRAKRVSVDRPDALAESVGAAADTHIDTAALARMLGPPRGSAAMDPARRERIEGVLEALDGYLAAEQDPVILVVHDDDDAEENRPAETDWRRVKTGSVSAGAAAVFDDTAAAYAPLFAAMRVARLELDDDYEPSRHDAVRHAFDWRAFRPDELLALPPIVALESAGDLAGRGMLDLSRLLLSGRPVNVIVAVQPTANPGCGPDDDPLAGYRFELGYLAISHREAVVNQSSAARPGHLLQGFDRSLRASRCALHIVAGGLSNSPAVGAWLHGGAALEGRAHPFFHYDPEAGETWARRLDFSGNPQPDADWPAYELDCLDADGGHKSIPIAFTFADVALMEPGYREDFRVLPAAAAGDDLITVDEYAAMPPEESLQRIAYTWAVDGENRLHRVVISRRLAFACRDRLGYWHTLQELAGVRNAYVREAVQLQREELEAAFRKEREQLALSHAAEIRRVRAEAAGEAMQRLAGSLLATDVSSFATAAAAPPLPAVVPAPPEAPAETPAEAPAETPTETPAEVQPDPDVETEEPWIETALCTTCNDCLVINPRLFVYNANKQAVISDPEAGTYDELVRGAELCPARCIHPGLPLNPDEPNLEELIKRAKPFN